MNTLRNDPTDGTARIVSVEIDPDEIIVIISPESVKIRWASAGGCKVSAEEYGKFLNFMQPEIDRLIQSYHEQSKHSADKPKQLTIQPARTKEMKKHKFLNLQDAELRVAKAEQLGEVGGEYLIIAKNIITDVDGSDRLHGAIVISGNLVHLMRSLRIDGTARYLHIDTVARLPLKWRDCHSFSPSRADKPILLVNYPPSGPDNTNYRIDLDPQGKAAYTSGDCWAYLHEIIELAEWGADETSPASVTGSAELETDPLTRTLRFEATPNWRDSRTKPPSKDNPGRMVWNRFAKFGEERFRFELWSAASFSSDALEEVDQWVYLDELGDQMAMSGTPPERPTPNLDAAMVLAKVGEVSPNRVAPEDVWRCLRELDLNIRSGKYDAAKVDK